jgi:hypothetical protein
MGARIRRAKGCVRVALSAGQFREHKQFNGVDCVDHPLAFGTEFTRTFDAVNLELTAAVFLMVTVCPLRGIRTYIRAGSARGSLRQRNRRNLRS